MFKAAYLGCLKDADSKKNRVTVATPTASVTVVLVKDFDDGANVAKSLVEEGIELIELCGAFGPASAAKIIEAVGGKIPVGVAHYGSESVPELARILSELD